MDNGGREQERKKRPLPNEDILYEGGGDKGENVWDEVR